MFSAAPSTPQQVLFWWETGWQRWTDSMATKRCCVSGPSTVQSMWQTEVVTVQRKKERFVRTA